MATSFFIIGCLISFVIEILFSLTPLGDRTKIMIGVIIACVFTVPVWSGICASVEFHMHASEMLNINETYTLEGVLASEHKVSLLGFSDIDTLTKYDIFNNKEVQNYLKDNNIDTSDRFNVHMYDKVDVKITGITDSNREEKWNYFYKTGDDSSLTDTEVTITPTGEEVHLEGMFSKEIRNGATLYTLDKYSFDDNRNTQSMLDFANNTEVSADILCSSEDLQDGVISSCKLKNIKHKSSIKEGDGGN